MEEERKQSYKNRWGLMQNKRPICNLQKTTLSDLPWLSLSSRPLFISMLSFTSIWSFPLSLFLKYWYPPRSERPCWNLHGCLGEWIQKKWTRFENLSRWQSLESEDNLCSVYQNTLTKWTTQITLSFCGSLFYDWLVKVSVKAQNVLFFGR